MTLDLYSVAYHTTQS